MLPGALSRQGSCVSRGAQAQSSGPPAALTSLGLAEQTDRHCSVPRVLWVMGILLAPGGRVASTAQKEVSAACETRVC